MSLSLVEALVSEIKSSPERAVPLSTYMGRCADFYYNHKDPFGTAGDFTTSPEISQMFGELLGLLLADDWSKRQPSPACLVELGGGRGTLMNDLLRAAKLVEGWEAHTDIYFIERSALLKAKQKHNVPRAIILDDFTAVPQDLPLYVVANEFFDALPIRQFQRTAKGWQERLVACSEDKFIWRLSEKINPALPDAPLNTIAETCEPAEDLVKEIAQRIKNQGGLAVIIDYGSDEEGCCGATLQAVKRHRFHPIFETPGEADITAHVRFATLIEVAKTTGVEVLPLQTQQAFLESLGIKKRAEMLAAGAAPAGQQAGQRAVSAALKRLTAPSHMGGQFKVMVMKHVL